MFWVVRVKLILLRIKTLKQCNSFLYLYFSIKEMGIINEFELQIIECQEWYGIMFWFVRYSILRIKILM